MSAMIQEQIKGEMKEAMKAREAARLTTLRGLLAAFTNEAVAKGYKPDQPLTDEEALAVIRRAVKQRQDAIAQFAAGGRADLAENEKIELALLEKYLPQMMPREEIRKIAVVKKAELGITDRSQMGKFIGTLMKEFAGRADGAEVKAVVEELLN